MKNPCKIDVRKRHAKSMENYVKREPKWEPKSIKNAKNAGKKACQKLCQNLMPKKSSKVLPRDPEMNDKGTKGEALGGKEGKPPKAALRYLASLI